MHDGLVYSESQYGSVVFNGEFPFVRLPSLQNFTERSRPAVCGLERNNVLAVEATECDGPTFIGPRIHFCLPFLMDQFPEAVVHRLGLVLLCE